MIDDALRGGASVGSGAHSAGQVEKEATAEGGYCTDDQKAVQREVGEQFNEAMRWPCGPPRKGGDAGGSTDRDQLAPGIEDHVGRPEETSDENLSDGRGQHGQAEDA